MDLGFSGPKFMWSNKRNNGLVMKRLDRALSNPQWKVLFEDAHVCHLPRTSSDHHPILLHTPPPTMHNFGPKPFYLETMWFNDPFFHSVIHQSWSKHPKNIEAAMDDFTVCVNS